MVSILSLCEFERGIGTDTIIDALAVFTTFERHVRGPIRVGARRVFAFRDAQLAGDRGGRRHWC